jgi:hypothetical protein
MERFRLRVRHEPKRGQIWELHLFPQHPHRPLREADGRILGSSATPEAVLWLRQIAGAFLSRAEGPSAISAEAFGPQAEPRWLIPEDGMRLALALSAARWLATPQQRRMFREGLEELPSEVVLYWFTLCFYGYRQSAGRAALRTFLTHEEPAEQYEEDAGIRQRKRPRETEPTLFSMTRSDLFDEGQESHADEVATEQSGIDMTSVGTRDASGMKQQRKAASSGVLKRSDTRRRKNEQEEVS